MPTTLTATPPTSAAPITTEPLSEGVPTDGSPRSRRRSRGRRLALVAASFLLVLSLAGCNRSQAQAALLVNASRADHGLPALKWNAALGRKAQKWAVYMANQGRISHSNLADGAPRPYRALGENVGYGTSIASVHRGYLGSPGHRANILNRRYTHIGTGVAKRNGRTYTVQVFMQR